VKLVAFYEGKANLTAPALNILRDSAMRALETDRVVHMRLDALGPRESDPELWRRRLQAVKDELVRLGVPADRVVSDGSGPYEVVIRQRVVPTTRSGRERSTLELIPDPLAGEDE
jgi:outer membrane protein OmpA-like peptidoglycan-associated protein